MSRNVVPEWGAIHGRFQPFHLGHFSYLLQAAARAEKVIIGITSPFKLAEPVVELTDRLRHLPSRNPFSYFERTEIITSAIMHHDRWMLERVRIVPFDVNGAVSSYSESMPLTAVQFVTAHEEWDVEKAQRFEQAGYSVEHLPPETSRITATSVRALMADGDDRWRKLVPEGTCAAISRLRLDRRLSESVPEEKAVQRW